MNNLVIVLSHQVALNHTKSLFVVTEVHILCKIYTHMRGITTSWVNFINQNVFSFKKWFSTFRYKSYTQAIICQSLYSAYQPIYIFISTTDKEQTHIRSSVPTEKSLCHFDIGHVAEHQSQAEESSIYFSFSSTLVAHQGFLSLQV